MTAIAVTLYILIGGGVARAAGWREVGAVKPESWSRRSRPRVDREPKQRKLRWEAA